MLNRIIQFSIKNKFIIGLFTLGLIGWGMYSATRLPIDALPDITNNQVQILTTSPTLATQEVEKFITYPIERELKSIPGQIELRSVSRFGLSLITVVFEEDIDIYWARNQITERLKIASENIPAGFGEPVLAPVSTGLGEIYQYVVYADSGYEDVYDAMALRTIQDWIVVPQILGTPGVAEVNTLGGNLKEYEVAVDPNKLKSANVTMAEIYTALSLNNENTGGAYIDKKPNAYYVRGVGMISELSDIKKIVIKMDGNHPVLIRDIAEVRFGSAIRYGATTKDGTGEVVSGMVMMLKGENSAEVVAAVKERVEKIRETLPEGVLLEPFLDRSKLVNNAVGTVEKNLIEGALIVIFILVLLIGNWRAGLIVASVIPLALLFAISLMNLFGVSGNLMSLGAIDFGLIVDGAVIIVEAILHSLQKQSANTRLTVAQMDDQVYNASSKIRTSAAFGEIIILIVYLPILVLVGIEGKMFGPMAQTVSFAILGAFILSLTYVPMMSALFLSKKIKKGDTFSDKIVAFLNRIYQSTLDVALKMKGLVVLVSVVLFCAALVLFRSLGGEFIPTLEEGDIATHIIIPPGSSLEQEIETTTKAEKLLMTHFPEIEQVVSKIGSAEVPTDPMPMEVADVMIILKPKKEWKTATTKEEMMEKMEDVLSVLPGVTTEFSQPIQMRFNELMTGVRSDVGIKIFGEDIDLLVGYGDQVVELIQSVDGVVDARAESIAGLPQITVNYDKDKLALYGLNVDELNQTLRMGFAGEKAGTVYEGEKRFDLVVRLQADARQDIDDIRNLYINLPSGSQIPLSQVADITMEMGPAQISREQGKRRIVIGFNVRNRDVQQVVEEIQQKIQANIKLPVGYYVEYAGQFENLEAANKRLSVAVPVALLFILVLLYFTFRNVKQSLLIFTAIPFSAIGGVLALWLRDMPFSISAGVGFIALFGVAVLNGIVLIGYLNQLKEEGMKDIIERIKEGTRVRLRPVIMTGAVASLGFLPMAMSNSAGAEVQKPLATVVMGGLITATLLTLIVLPILYYFVETGFKFKKRGAGLVTLLVAAFLPFSGFTQVQQMNVDDFIQKALSQNQQMKWQELNIERYDEMKKTAFEIPKTTVSGTFGQINSVNFDQNFSVSQQFNPALFGAKKELLKQRYTAAKLDSVVMADELKLEVRMAYNEVVYNQNRYVILLEQDSLLAKFATSAAKKYAFGEADIIEKITAETASLQSKSSLPQAEKNLQVSMQKLAILTGIPYGSYQLVDKQLIPVNSMHANAAIQNNPVVQKANQEIAVAKGEKQVNKAEAFPEITAGYFIQSFKGEQVVNGEVVNFNATPQFQGFTIGLSIPVFYRANKAKINMANTTVLMQEQHADYVHTQLGFQLDMCMQQMEVLRQMLVFYEETALPNARLIIEKSQVAYDNGEINYVAYSQALLTALDIRQQNLDTIKKYNEQVYTLNYLINQ